MSEVYCGFDKANASQLTGSQLSKAKEDAAAIMRAKQAAGKLESILFDRGCMLYHSCERHEPGSWVLMRGLTHG